MEKIIYDWLYFNNGQFHFISPNDLTVLLSFSFLMIKQKLKRALLCIFMKKLIPFQNNTMLFNNLTTVIPTY